MKRDNSIENSIRAAVNAIQRADGLLITAGAGISIDSGLPDFRGGAGMWTAYPALKHLNLDFKSMANPQKFGENPRLGWGWYGHRLQDYREKNPHDGFRMLIEMGNHRKNGYFVFTSNIDGHFQKAGVPQESIYEIHGSIHDFQCSKKCCLDIWSAESFIPSVDMNTCTLLNDIPTCPRCGAIARPCVLMFDDYHYVQVKNHVQERRMHQWINKNKFTVAIEIGAGTAIPTIQWYGSQFSDLLIRINPSDYSVWRSQDISIPLGGLDGISKIYGALTKVGESNV